MDIKLIPIENQEVLRNLFVDCQPILEENLVANGGTLKQANLIEQDFKWSHLAIVKRGELCLGFALMRFSEYDQHKTSFEKYYYISQIAISKKLQNMGIGSVLLQYVLENVTDYPIIASVDKKNEASMRLFEKNNMIPFGETAGYFRFMDKKSYELINDVHKRK